MKTKAIYLNKVSNVKQNEWLETKREVYKILFIVNRKGKQGEKNSKMNSFV